MYNEIYEIWTRELEKAELEKITSDFYSRASDYLRKLKEESRMLDKRTVKANLLKSEMQNVKRMLNELVRIRYKKLVKNASRGQKIPSSSLAIEEEKIYAEILSIAETYQRFAQDLLQGRVLKMNVKHEKKRTVLRFLKDIPTIVGADMKTYGPFKAEDVASLPIENAKILIKQHLAERVDVE